jgi:hypothetical protein
LNQKNNKIIFRTAEIADVQSESTPDTYYIINFVERTCTCEWGTMEYSRKKKKGVVCRHLREVLELLGRS